MKITVDRPEIDENSDSLTFIITVTEPHEVKFGEEELRLLDHLDQCGILTNKLEYSHKFKDKVVENVYDIKAKLFDFMISNLKFTIKNSLETKFHPICQEIYNWIYDKQKEDARKWLQEFDPQRVKYYFDNDKTCESDYEDNDRDEFVDEDRLY